MTDYLQENLSLLYKISGWSYDTLSMKLNEGLPDSQKFSRDQIRSYEKKFSAPKAHFKNVLAKFFGLEARDIVSRKLTVAEINEVLKNGSDDQAANSVIPLYSLTELKRKIEEQWQVIMSQQETILINAKRAAPDINDNAKNG